MLAWASQISTVDVNTEFTRTSAAAFVNFFVPQVRRLFDGYGGASI